MFVYFYAHVDNPRTNELQTTSGADGTITAWDVSEREPKVEKLIDGIIPAVADTE